MPVRKAVLSSGEIYHVFNRGIDRRQTFIDKREYQRMVKILEYYIFSHPPVKLSRFLLMNQDDQKKVKNVIAVQNNRLVEILCFCLMPNHYHLLLRQLQENGISKFIGQIQNSYTRYFNTKNERNGPLFLDQFSAVRIETDYQLLHVSRYIHLNPYTGFVLKALDELERFPWSTFALYINENKKSSYNSSLILDMVGDGIQYKEFVFDNADYQRQLGKIKHLLLED